MHDGLPETADEFEDILARRMVLGQAIGILMERNGIDADEAFLQLRAVSQSGHGVKITEIARSLVETRALPDIKVPKIVRPTPRRLSAAHAPAPLVAADLHLVECACGWRSWGYSSRSRAEQEHTRHVTAAAGTSQGPHRDPEPHATTSNRSLTGPSVSANRA